MRDVINWRDLSQNFHTLISRQYISIRLLLEHESGCQSQDKFEKNSCEMDRLFFGMSSLAFSAFL